MPAPPSGAIVAARAHPSIRSDVPLSGTEAAMADPRELLTAYVATGKVMQLSTLDDDGGPYVSNLWFASTFHPDRLSFISRPHRQHCRNIRLRQRVAGAILAIELDDPSQPVRGATFTGLATELPIHDIDPQIGVYVRRWPSAASAIDPVRMAAGQAHHRLYEIRVEGWVLYDEINFRGAPRQLVDAR
jgi:uncharacterized protein YhbP (UPF0306 family)